MATKPMAWQEQGPFSSLDALQVEECVRMSHSCPLRDKRAPKATPEEDVDILEPGDDVKAPQQNQTIKIIQMKKQESSGISPCASRMTLPKQRAHQEEDAFPPPPSPSALSTGEYCEKDGEATEWISEVELISDPKEDLTSLDSQDSQEWSKNSQLTETVDREENVANMTENNRYQPVNHPHSDSNNSDVTNTGSSPPFADESEEEEVGIDTMSCEHQWSTPDLSGQVPKPSFPPSGQAGELLPQSKCRPASRGVNQEAAQQVLGRRSPPVSTVSMELSNQGGAVSQGFGCAVTGRERKSRVGERTKGENEQTGGEEGRTESKLGKNKTPGQPHHGELVRYSTAVQTGELNTGRYQCGASLKQNRMENEMCDDSQSDSGVSADFSPGSTMEGTSTTSTASPGTGFTETPIEREIRRAIEREQSLRRSRGLPNRPTSPEYIEIPLRKTAVCHQQRPNSWWSQAKDREFAGKKMQHEISEETKREQALVKIGKVPGFYDKGTVRQIKEKKKIFEVFQTPSEPACLTPAKSKVPSCSSDNLHLSTVENQEGRRSPGNTLGEPYVKRRHSLDILKSPNATKGCVTESGSQVIILENNLTFPAQKAEKEDLTAVDSASPHSSLHKTQGHNGLMEGEEEKQEEVASKENPFFKLRSSTNLVKVKQDILDAQEREKELRNQRISLYGGSSGAKGGGGRSIGVEETSSMSSPSKTGETVPEVHLSLSKGGARPSGG